MEKQPTGLRKNWVYTEPKDEQTPATEVLGVASPVSDCLTSKFPLYFLHGRRGSLQLSQNRQTNQYM